MHMRTILAAAVVSQLEVLRKGVLEEAEKNPFG